MKSTLTISVHPCRDHSPTAHATPIRAHKPAGKLEPDTSTGHLTGVSCVCNPESSCNDCCYDCLKGWRTCIHHTCGNPQKNPELMCWGNTGSAVIAVAPNTGGRAEIFTTPEMMWKRYSDAGPQQKYQHVKWDDMHLVSHFLHRFSPLHMCLTLFSLLLVEWRNEAVVHIRNLLSTS